MDGYSLCKRHQHRTVATSNERTNKRYQDRTVATSDGWMDIRYVNDTATSTQSGYVVQNYFEKKTSGTFRSELRRILHFRETETV